MYISLSTNLHAHMYLRERRLFLVMDMQTPPSKRAVSIYLSKLLRSVRKRMNNQFSDFCEFYFLRYNRSKMRNFSSIWLQKR